MEKKETGQSRRDFLKLATAAAPAVVAAAAMTPEAVEAAELDGTGLRKTEHVKKYLETARF